jgi:hypothetical protein
MVPPKVKKKTLEAGELSAQVLQLYILYGVIRRARLRHVMDKVRHLELMLKGDTLIAASCWLQRLGQCL